MKIDSPRLSEYDEILRFLEDVYGHSYDYFPLAYPQAWKKENADFRNVFVIRERGEIVSLVRIFPLGTVQNGVSVKLAGIGSVSTAYSRRGKGYMSELLQRAFQEMEKQKFPLSVLGGDRHRYGHFGYENGGRIVEMRISPRGFDKNVVRLPAVKRFTGDEKTLARMKKAYDALKYRKSRTFKEMRELYTKPGVMACYAANGKDFASVVLSATEFRDGGKKVLEFTGSDELVMGILHYLAERFKIPGFSLGFPDFSDVPFKMMSAASGWSVNSEMMIKIINLKQTLQAFSGQPGFLFPDGEEVTLSIRDRESVLITKKNGRLRVENGRGANEVALGEMDMVRLLFGLSFWAPEGAKQNVIKVLRQFLPFNLFLGRLDHI